MNARRKKWEKLMRRIGRRGASLLILSVVFLLYGLNILLASPLPEDEVIYGQYVILDAIAPLVVWGGAWVGCSLLAALQAFSRSADARGAFVSLTFITSVWGIAMLLSYAADVGARDPRILVNGLMWVGVAGLTIVVAGWKEDPRRYRRSDARKDGRRMEDREGPGQGSDGS